MRLNEINNFNIWGIAKNKFISLSECACEIHEIPFTDDYVFLRKHNQKDKNNILVKEGDILRINPDDDYWDDIVIYRPISKDGKEKGLELLRYCLGSDTQVDLRNALSEDNPALIVGNVLTTPSLAMKALSYR